MENKKLAILGDEKVQGNMSKAKETRASKLSYVSQNQLKLEGFETPFEQNLDPENRWVIMAHCIPWDRLVGIYNKKKRSNYGASKINGRIAIGSLIIKYLCDLSDRDVLSNIQENIYMQYFLGLSSFCNKPLFDPSLLTEMRKRLSEQDMIQINELVIDYWNELNDGPSQQSQKEPKQDEDQNSPENNSGQQVQEEQTNKGSLIMDATVCPQDIAYPTDLNLLSEGRELVEKLIDKSYEIAKVPKKARTYRKIARKQYLKVAQNRNPSRKVIRNGIKQQLQYLKRDIKILDNYLNQVGLAHLTNVEYKQMLVIKLLYDQQMAMFKDKTHSCQDRIVSIHQPHVRPIVRGKRTAKVEFGAKIQIGLTNGLCYLDHLSWDAYNEGVYLQKSVDEYKRRTGHYPKEVLADKIYCTRVNRAWLKEKGILLKAKPLGRPSALSNQVSPGERNPIEGKFGVAKSKYGLQRVKARLANTSSSWIAGIILVLNLVKLAGISAYCLVLTIITQILGYDRQSNFIRSF